MTASAASISAATGGGDDHRASASERDPNPADADFEPLGRAIDETARRLTVGWLIADSSSSASCLVMPLVSVLVHDEFGVGCAIRAQRAAPDDRNLAAALALSLDFAYGGEIRADRRAARDDQLEGTKWIG